MADSAGDDRWYPGKHLKVAADKFGATKLSEKITAVKTKLDNRKAMKESGQLEDPSNPLLLLHNTLKAKRELAKRSSAAGVIGVVEVEFLRGSFGCSRPFFFLELDGNEERIPSTLTSTPVWGEGAIPKASVTLPVIDPSSDLRMFLCDDGGIHNERPIGRVILPLRMLCEDSMLQMPKGAHSLTLEVMPATRQQSDALQARYVEAVPHTPGTGMVRPKENLGCVELRIQLILDVPGLDRIGLLAAYAQVPPDATTEEGDDDEVATQKCVDSKEDKLKVDPAQVRRNAMRLKRCLVKPFLLRKPYVFGMPVVHMILCYGAKVHHAPLVMVALNLANGVLDYLHRAEHTQELIYWEDSVGESDMPKGLQKIKLLLNGLGELAKVIEKLAGVLEKQRNFSNFADPTVSMVAHGTATVLAAVFSAVLYLIPNRLLLFIAGMVVLAPQLAQAANVKPQVPSPPRDTPEGSAPTLPAKWKEVLQMLKNVLLRVPDGRDTSHQHFCALQLTNKDLRNRVSSTAQASLRSGASTSS